MSMRISKYPPIGGTAVDAHGKLPGAVPPAPVPNPVPTSPWLVTISVPTMAGIVSGKWSLASVVTEGMGDILWGHDWGALQPHVPITPHYATPSIASLLAGSSSKYFLPSFAVKEPQDGALPGGEVPVAVSYASFFIMVQQCQDTGPGLSYVNITGVSFQNVSTRWVGFNFGDMFAGVISMAFDTLNAVIVSKAGGSFLPGSKGFNSQMMGGFANGMLSNALSGMLGAATSDPETGPMGASILSATGLKAIFVGKLIVKSPGMTQAGALMIGPTVSWIGGIMGGAAGDALGSDPSQTGGEPGVEYMSGNDDGGSEPDGATGGGATDAGTSGGAPDGGTSGGAPDGGTSGGAPDGGSGGYCEPEDGTSGGSGSSTN